MSYKAYSDSLLARTLNSRDNRFANISENKVLTNISGSTVIKNYLWNKLCICSIILHTITLEHNFFGSTFNVSISVSAV